MSDTGKKGHGGNRKGAGRKRKDKSQLLIPRYIYLKQEQIFALKGINLSKYVRDLIDKNLQELVNA